MPRCCKTLADQGHELPGAHPGMAAAGEAEIHLCRRAGRGDQSRYGRVHTSFAMAIASTGRLSSTDPNLQNIPIRTEEGSRIRRAFIAEPGPCAGQRRLLADRAAAAGPCRRYSGAEARAFANGEDIHARTASEVFGVPMAGHGPDDPPAGEGDQFRHHLRHQRLRPGAAAADRAGRGAALYRALFRALSRHPRTTWSATKEEARIDGLCADARSAAAAGFPASPTRTRRGAAMPSGRRSTRRCRAGRPISSSAPWCGCRRRCAAAGLSARHAAAGA